MEHRKSKNLWLKLAGVSVSYSVVTSSVGLYWQQKVFPVLLGEDPGGAWVVLVTLCSILIWGVLPAVAALLLLGRLYGQNFFVGFWRRRRSPGEFEPRLFSMFVATVSGPLSIWFVIGPLLGEKIPTFAISMLFFIWFMSARLSEILVHAERAVEERDHTDEADGGSDADRSVTPDSP